MSVGDILRKKGPKVVTIRPEATLLEAIRMLVGNGIGSLLVTDEKEQIVGIITERDILRDSLKRHDHLGRTRVSDIMTRDVIIGVPEDSLDYVMNLMTSKRFRHLPVMSGETLAGIISIGDVVKAKARDMELDIRHLTDYITGKYPG